MIQIDIKILNSNHLEEFRAIRLEALLKAPKMFGSNYKAEVEKPHSFFLACLIHSIVFGAFYQNEMVGFVTLTKETMPKLAHKSHLNSLYIKPKYQNKGISNQLLEAIICFSQAQDDLEQILLSVAQDNPTAIHLYKKFGFQIYGIESKALKDNDEYNDELLMKLFLA